MRPLLLGLPLLLALSGAAAGELEREVPDQPPGKPAREKAFSRSPGARVAFGSYESIQINVDASGNNIVGDAANEPSLAVNPLNKLNMVAGWRQFDTVSSNFRQAGWAYTMDGGQTWTFTGVLTPGTFRSDPSLDVSSTGVFYYQSLKGDLTLDVFTSIDGGVSWGGGAPSFGGDKNWLAVDRTGLASDGYLYGIWQRFGGACCGNNVFTRSTSGATSWQNPVVVSRWPTFGTLTVGPSAEVYATGIDGSVGQDTSHYVVAKSTNAGNPMVSPTFTGSVVNLGGSMLIGAGPNPEGLLGQPNVMVNTVTARRGEVYVVGSTSTGTSDPIDVHMIRSSDGGASWSAPVRVNDDLGNNWQWMAAASVAPNGRIDAIWNDTRGAGHQSLAQLFYAYSWDGGATWSPNVAVSPPFNTSLGYPQQLKMGDYIGLVSNNTGADAIYTATFNSEEDVYYVHLFPDCNGNGISDVTDLAGPSSDDCNLNQLPDECEAAPICLGAGGLPEAGTDKLTVVKISGGDILVRWGPSCRAGDADYALYEGTIGSFGNATPRFCSTGGAKVKIFTPAPGGTYYLAVPVHADRDGSYGTLTGGGERPPESGACNEQDVRTCVP